MGGKGTGQEMIVRFWGVRGSVPTPLSSRQIEEKIVSALRGASEKDIGNTRKARKYVEGLSWHINGTAGGNTSCVELHSDDNTIIFDAGSGIRPLGIYLMEHRFSGGAGTVHLFLSHTHWDHIQGFPFFLPAYAKGVRIIIYGGHPDLERRLSMQQNDAYFPVSLQAMQAEIEFVSLPWGEGIAIDDVRVTSMELNHPGGSFAYRVQKGDKSLVYATDTEFTRVGGKEIERYMPFFLGATAMIFDSQYTLTDAIEKEDWGHSSSLTGVDIARDARVEKLILFHHEPTYDDATLRDILLRTRKYAKLQGVGSGCEVIMAREGLELVL